MSYGIKDNAFAYFLLFVYVQIFGLAPDLAGLAILLMLVFDAFSDPLVGYFSDRHRSSWGRRHPFMYFSAIPVSLSFFLLWDPPDVGSWAGSSRMATGGGGEGLTASGGGGISRTPADTRAASTRAKTAGQNQGSRLLGQNPGTDRSPSRLRRQSSWPRRPRSAQRARRLRANSFQGLT